MPHRQLLTAPPHRPTPLLLAAKAHLLAIVGKAAPHCEGRAARIFFFSCPDGVALTRRRDASSTHCRTRRNTPRDVELEPHRSAGARQLPSPRGVGHRTAVSYSCLPPVLTSSQSLPEQSGRQQRRLRLPCAVGLWLKSFDNQRDYGAIRLVATRKDAAPTFDVRTF